MPMTYEQERLLERIFAAHAATKEPPSMAAYIIHDLGIAGSDYLDFVSDIERTFNIDMTDFLLGSKPKYVSNGLAGLLVGQRQKPVFRDVTIGEIKAFVAKSYAG